MNSFSFLRVGSEVIIFTVFGVLWRAQMKQISCFWNMEANLRECFSFCQTLNNDKISLNDQSWPKKEKETGKNICFLFWNWGCCALCREQLTVAMVRISVWPHASWNTEINIKREVEFLLRNPHARPPSDWPSQDVGCRPWSSTSCASTPNTSCPLAPALINRKITVRGEVGVSTLMCHFILSVLLFSYSY